VLSSRTDLLLGATARERNMYAHVSGLSNGDDDAIL
jgi:hypothetical protein